MGKFTSIFCERKKSKPTWEAQSWQKKSPEIHPRFSPKTSGAFKMYDSYKSSIDIGLHSWFERDGHIVGDTKTINPYNRGWVHLSTILPIAFSPFKQPSRLSDQGGDFGERPPGWATSCGPEMTRNGISVSPPPKTNMTLENPSFWRCISYGWGVSNVMLVFRSVLDLRRVHTVRIFQLINGVVTSPKKLVKAVYDRRKDHHWVVNKTKKHDKNNIPSHPGQLTAGFPYWAITKKSKISLWPKGITHQQNWSKEAAFFFTAPLFFSLVSWRFWDPDPQKLLASASLGLPVNWMIFRKKKTWLQGRRNKNIIQLSADFVGFCWYFLHSHPSDLYRVLQLRVNLSTQDVPKYRPRESQRKWRWSCKTKLAFPTRTDVYIYIILMFCLL